jgi:hypothetical protein
VIKQVVKGRAGEVVGYFGKGMSMKKKLKGHWDFLLMKVLTLKKKT